jgi:WD40 repeat protein
MTPYKLAFIRLIPLCLIGLYAALAFCGQPSDEPILRIEDELDHTASIVRVALDAENRYIITASHDKTVKVWDISKGRKLSCIIRPPIGQGQEGKLLALAVSPDGNTIACGGYTGYDWDKAFTIYLFDRQSGSMMGSITGLPHIICQLAFSKDGRFLAAGLGGKGGIRVYRISKQGASISAALLSEDRNYGDHVFGADFDVSGKLVTSSFDGYIRLYDPDHRLAAKTRIPDRLRPHQVSFSPDGGKIAVGFNDFPTVAVLSSADISLLLSPDTKDRATGDFACVSWSSDGRFLYGGGRHGKIQDGKLRVYIRKWSEEGRGPYTDIVTAKNTIQHILPLKTGGILFGSSDATWGFVDRQGRENQSGYWGGQLLSDFRGGDKSDFLISHDGSVVQYNYMMEEHRPARFSLFDRTVEYDKALNPSDSAHAIKPPATAVDGLKLTDWHENKTPKLNGRPLKIDSNEISRCGAISPDKKVVLIGTDWHIYFFDKNGRQIRKILTPAVVWLLNISGDGRYAVAGLGDGTIRWYTMAEGKEQCIYFPLGSQRQWVLWIPEGYFDASLEGGKYFVYHLNQGKDKEGRIIPVNWLYDVFYRPDMVARKFKGEDIKEMSGLTARQALQAPPPTVYFNYPPFFTDKPKFKVCYEATAKNGGIGEVRLFHNGKLVRSDGYYRSLAVNRSDKMDLKNRDSNAMYHESRGIAIVDKGFSPVASPAKGTYFKECTELDTVSGLNEVGVVAFNENNTVQSFMETHRIQSTYKEDAPRLYVLAIGIDRYQERDINLKYAAKDARDFLLRMTHQMSTLYPADRIDKILLIDADATKEGILSTVERLSNIIKPGDHFILFAASHGVLIQNQYHMIPSNYAGNMDKDSLISSNEIVDMSKKIKSLKQFYIFDTCYAGGVDSLILGLYDARISVLAKKMGLHIYASASSTQQAMDGYEGNGLFTHVLLTGLDNGNGADRDGDGKVSIVELGEFAKRRVSDISKQIGHAQLPVTINFGTDWPIYALPR